MIDEFGAYVSVLMPDGEKRRWPAHYESHAASPGDFFRPTRLVPEHMPGHRVEELVGGGWVAYVYRVAGE